MNKRFVLMYHRICERSPDTECWFLRGTAVTPQAFQGQIKWLCNNYSVVPLHELLTSSRQEPLVALTFDDGYADIATHALPYCQHLGITATCFVPAGPVVSQSALWFDVWYSLAQQGILRDNWQAILRKVGLPECSTLADAVQGPCKKALGAMSTKERVAVLEQVEDGVGITSKPRYLTNSELLEFLQAGWTIGGHGVWHERLQDVSPKVVGEEVQGSADLLLRLGVEPPWCFSYPDGSWDERVAARIEQAGFATACTVEPGDWNSKRSLLAIPRLFCRGNTEIPHSSLVREAALP